MRKLLLTFLVLAVIASCGKDNKVASANGSSGSTNPITISDTTGVSLGSLIDNHGTSFGVGQATYYETWNKVASNSPNIYYEYAKSSSSGFTFSFCFTSCSTNSTVTRTILHSQVVVLDKQNELKSIINRKSAFYPITVTGTGTGAIYRIVADDGVYTIDTRYPIQANPTQIQRNNQSQVEYLRSFR